MTLKNDLDLLGEFILDQSQDAFTALVQRHLNLVYCAALRQVRSPQLAEEVAQSVFTDLAANAAGLKPDTVLTAWLYQVTRRTAIDVVRSETRRQLREQIAVEMNVMNATTADWTQIEPILDEAMHALDDNDRTAILLRYFENKSLREVGQTLGTTDDTARKRVNRAIEQLREFIAKRGIAIGATGLTVVISANAAHAAPIALVATFSSAALASATSGSGTLSILKIMATTKLKAGLISTILVASAVTSVVFYQQAQASLHEADQALRQRQMENERLTGLASLVGQPAVNNLTELQRLRNEVAALHERTNGLATLREESRQLQASLSQARRDPKSAGVRQTLWSEDAKVAARYSRDLAMAAVDYAFKHGEQYPTNLADAAIHLSTETLNQTNLVPSQFEIVYTGSRTAFAKYANRGNIIVIRQKQPWKNSDGLWVKAYAFADGSGSVLAIADDDFESWERDHVVPSEASKP